MEKPEIVPVIEDSEERTGSDQRQIP